MALPDIARRTYRFHTNKTYWIEGCLCSTLSENETNDVPNIGIIGQDEVINQIMTLVFEPREISAVTRRKHNLKLVHGVVLYGPPGTGKTSIVRGICNYLQIQPRVVNGPELLNQFVGNSEHAVCELFDKALADQVNFGDESPLHVIVLDEMEALFPRRSFHIGESNTRNTVVSQMLTMMNSYTQRNNIVVFGTTNRLDMVDPALLRSGRFDLTIKIDLPNAQGRFEILQFLTNELRNNGVLASDVTEQVLSSIAYNTINYSGSDLVQLAQHASLFSIKRVIKNSKKNLNGKRELDESKAIVDLNDIIGALRSVEHQRYRAEQS